MDSGLTLHRLPYILGHNAVMTSFTSKLSMLVPRLQQLVLA